MIPLASRDRRIRTIALAAVWLTVLSGCASRGGSLGRFVTPGEPTISFDTTVVTPEPATLTEYARQLRTLQASARTNVTLGTTIESQNPRVASAVLRVSMAPTAENHRLLADAYIEAGIRDYAYKHLKRASQLEPCDGLAFEGLARLWRDWGAPELALSEAHRAVYCRPHSAGAHNTLGTVLTSLGQLKSARAAFERSVQLDPAAAFALNNLCYVALQEGNGRAAQRACEETLALEPTMLAAQTNLALAYALQDDAPKAEARLLDSPDTAAGLYNVGILRMSLSQYGEAVRAFVLALEARPSLAQAAQRAEQSRARALAEREK
jgi:Flp pilus assembly protein TadD